MKTPSLQHMAMISTLHIGMIGISGKDESATAKANAHLQTKDAAGYYTKCKVNRDDIRDLLTTAGLARSYRRKHTRPWGQNDTRLLPAYNVIEFQDQLKIYQDQFNDHAKKLQNNWPNIVRRQQQRLGPLFNPLEYPTQHEVRDLFTFEFEMLPVPAGSHIVLDLEKQVLDKLQRQLERKNKRRMIESMKEMWNRLYEPVAKMAEVCTLDKAVYTSMIDNVEEAVQVLSALNITNDRKFDDMVAEINRRLVGYTPQQIRKNKDLKRSLGAAASDVSAKLETIMGADNAGTTVP